MKEMPAICSCASWHQNSNSTYFKSFLPFENQVFEYLSPTVVAEEECLLRAALASHFVVFHAAKYLISLRQPISNVKQRRDVERMTNVRSRRSLCYAEMSLKMQVLHLFLL